MAMEVRGQITAIGERDGLRESIVVPRRLPETERRRRERVGSCGCPGSAHDDRLRSSAVDQRQRAGRVARLRGFEGHRQRAIAIRRERGAASISSQYEWGLR